MSAKIISDNEFDRALIQKKDFFLRLQKEAQSYMTNYISLPPRERARALLAIQSGIKDLQRFVSTAHSYEMTNAGTKFSYDNLRSGLNSFVGRWSKFEKSLG